MRHYQTEAILLAVRDWGNADRMVTLFSREYGKLSAVAYGSRHARSALAGSIQQFTHAEVALMGGKGLDSIQQCEVKRSFKELRENLMLMAYGSLLAEIAIELWPEREPAPAAFDILLATLELLSVRNPRIATQACAWQLLTLAGYRPEFRNCVVCGRTVIFPAVFNIQAGGLACRECATAADFECSLALQELMNILLELNFSLPPAFNVNSKVLAQAEKLLNQFLTYRLEKPLKSIAFIKMFSDPPKRG